MGGLFIFATRKQTVEIDNNGLDPATGATLLPTGSYSESYQRTSPKIGLIYRLAKDTEVYANVSGSFEPPSFSETLNNQPLKAQRAMALLGLLKAATWAISVMPAPQG